MPALSDEDLRRELEQYDFAVPPITATTRPTLLKKLEQFRKKRSATPRSTAAVVVDGDPHDVPSPTKGSRQLSRSKKKIGSGSHSSSKKSSATASTASVAPSLIDYSSAEEELASSSSIGSLRPGKVTAPRTGPSKLRRSTNGSSAAIAVRPPDGDEDDLEDDDGGFIGTGRAPSAARAGTAVGNGGGGGAGGGATSTPKKSLQSGKQSVGLNGHYFSPSRPSPSSAGPKRKLLMNYSEEEDEEENHKYGEDRKTGKRSNFLADLGIQTSPRLDESSASPSPSDDDDDSDFQYRHRFGRDSNGDAPRYSFSQWRSYVPSGGRDPSARSSFSHQMPGSVEESLLRFRGGGNVPADCNSRFSNSSPPPQVKDTSSYLKQQQQQQFPLSSPLRQIVAKNSKAFGSLGEALASIPSGRPPPALFPHNALPSGGAMPKPSSASDVTTQAVKLPTVKQSSAKRRFWPFGGLWRSSGGAHSSTTSSSGSTSESPPKKTALSSHTISTLIVLTAGLFFMVVTYKYATLRPSSELRHRLPVCDGDKRWPSESAIGSTADDGTPYPLQQNRVGRTRCFDEEYIDDLQELFSQIVETLEAAAVEAFCSGGTDSSATMTVSEILASVQNKKLESGAPMVDVDPESMEDEGAVAGSPSSLAPFLTGSSFAKSMLSTLIGLIKENPQWGVSVVEAVKEGRLQRDGGGDDDPDEFEKNEEGQQQLFLDFDATRMFVTNPPISLICWLVHKVHQAIQLIGTVAVYLAVGGALAAVSYGLYRLYLWRQESVLQEQQEVFELVEQVLSLLMAQHHFASSCESPGGALSPLVVPYVWVDHVRDQLIPPQNRKKKQKIWNKVAAYIRESESRVKENVSNVHGEENLVWQWIPDVHWTPLNHPGHRPYKLGPNSPVVPSAPVSGGLPSPPAPGTSSQSPLNSFRSPAMFAAAVPRSGSRTATSPGKPTAAGSPQSPSTSPSWQGAAFNNLDRNVAAPTVAPTSCLKVRHLFDRQMTRSPVSPPSSSASPHHGWVWQVKEEVLRRCCSASPPAEILHIAVDTESTEGCVYIKAKNTDEAGKVFRSLHGQWYRGNLVTVKYLREERYFDRFPDARHQTTPLQPQAQPNNRPKNYFATSQN